MRAKDTFSQAQLRLQAAGCRYRIKQGLQKPLHPGVRHPAAPAPTGRPRLPA